MSAMITRHIRLVSAVVLPLAAAGCVTTDYSAKDAGFTTASSKSGEATGKQTVWVQNREQAQAVRDRVKALMARKTVDVETAVQVALLNNKGLQASYADLGDSAADAWQTQLSVFPTFSVGLTGIATPGLEAYRVLEGAVAANILALATYDKNIKLADTRFRQAQLNAAIATISLGAETRRAWIDAVAAWENVAYLNQAKAAADAASELAKKIGEAGSMPKADQAREHVFYAELTGETAKARLEAKLAKEELVRLMGLSGSDIDFQIPNRLPSLPKALIKRDDIEAESIHKRMDLQVAPWSFRRLLSPTSSTMSPASSPTSNWSAPTKRNASARTARSSRTCRRPHPWSSGSRSSIPARRVCERVSSPTCGLPTSWRNVRSTPVRKPAPPTSPTGRTTISRATTETTSCHCALRSRNSPSSPTTA
jgi:hypothetical protein